ncbi:MAG: metal ABC transporter solute-binding protein, Zn/Mn family [Candidatus Methanofastidiosia archaeon]
MKKVFSLIGVLLIVVSFISGCIAGNEQGTEDKLGVVVSIAPYAEWVKNVGGDKVDVTILIPPGASPHTYEPTPSQLIKVSNAKIFVKNGVGLEFWTDKIAETNKNILIVDISEGIELMPLSSEEAREHGLLYDPHIWLSLKNAKKGVRQICETLSEIDPDNESYYITNMNKYVEKLDMLDGEITEKLYTVENKKIIVFHPAWSYFCKDYGLEQIPVEQEGKEPGPQYIAEIIKTAKENNITVVFVEPQFNQNSARIIANEINGNVVAIDPLAENYIENMRITVDKLIEGLE